MNNELTIIKSTELVPGRNGPAQALQPAEPQAAPALELPEQRAERMREVAGNAKSDNTQKAYRTQQGLYVMWARAKGIAPEWPANPANVWIWLQERADGLPTQAWETDDPAALKDDAGRPVIATYVNADRKTQNRRMVLAKPQKNSTLMAALAAIKAYHTQNDLPFNDKDLSLVEGLKGMRRSNVTEARQMAAMKPDLIDRILRTFTDNERKSKKPCARDIRDAALISMLYVFAMRRSELECLDYAELSEDGCGVLRIDHEKAERVLYRSKTSQDEAKSIFVAREHNPRMFAALERWIEFAGIKPGTPLMRPITPKRTVSKKRLSGDGIHNALRAAIVRYYVGKGTDRAKAEEYAKQFGGHSGRVGFVVASREAGGSYDDIMRRTGQASHSTAARYGKSADQLRNSVDQLDGVGF